MSDTPKTEFAGSENRKARRISLTMPVRIDGKDSENTDWNEISRTRDLSPFGIGFGLSREIRRGSLLRFTFAMPDKMRSFDFMESQYKVWGIVTSCRRGEPGDPDKSFSLGAKFIGKNPPPSYLSNPRQRYDMVHNSENETYHLVPFAGSDENRDQADSQTIERKHSRFQIPINIVVGIVDSSGEISSSETTVMENVSLGGAAVFSSLNVSIGSTVQVTNDHYKANLTATVKQKRTGDDGIPRLHIEFTNGQFPLPEID